MPKTYPDIGTFTSGQILTAATMNDVGTNLDNFRVPAMCRVTKASAQTINDNTVTALQFDTEAFDTDGMHDNVTNNTRITFQTAGVYLVTACVTLNTGVDSFTRLTIRLGGTTNLSGAEIGGSGGDAPRLVPSLLYEFTAGQYVEAMLTQDNTANTSRTTTSGETWFSALWVGQLT